VGSFTFSTKDTFTETDLVLVSYSTKAFGAEQAEVESSIFARVSTDPISSSTAAGATTADFDGDGTVGFSDFFMFADAFGKPLPDLRYDLDGDEEIGFGDFFMFADAFGKAAKWVVSSRMPTQEGGLALAAESSGSGVWLDLRTEQLGLRGYAAVVEYDAEAFRLIEVSDARSVLHGESSRALLLEQDAEGQILLAGSRTGSRAAVEGLLAQLHFEPLYPAAEGVFRIREAQVRRADGDLGQAQALGQVEVRLAPERFALEPNYPNPFNPSTTIRYQLPESGSVHLEIFDVVGQKVRTLIAEVQPAGMHQVLWDSRDDSSRPVAAGVYFYRLQVRDAAGQISQQDGARFSQVRKLLLLK